MRELKFRAWLKGKKKICPVKGLSFDYCNIIGMKSPEIGVIIGEPYRDKLSIENKKSIEVANHHPKIDTCILIEYSGAKDCKRTEDYPDGEEIYEGDLLEVSDGISTWITLVQFDEETGAWHRFKDYSVGKIVGNIFQNPELLEVKK